MPVTWVIVAICGPAAAGPCGQRHGEVGRVQPPVGGQPDRTQHTGGIEQPMEPLARLLGRDQLQGQCRKVWAHPA